MNPTALIQMTNAVGGARLTAPVEHKPKAKAAPTLSAILEFLVNHPDQAWTVGEMCGRLDAEMKDIHTKLYRHANMKASKVRRTWVFTEDGSYRHRAYQIKPEFVEAVLGVAA